MYFILVFFRRNTPFCAKEESDLFPFSVSGHLAVPNTPSAGFNFTPGSSGMAGSPFASSSPAPAFGAPSTPQGPNSMLTARSRARVAARRRGKK